MSDYDRDDEIVDLYESAMRRPSGLWLVVEPEHEIMVEVQQRLRDRGIVLDLDCIDVHNADIQICAFRLAHGPTTEPCVDDTFWSRCEFRRIETSDYPYWRDSPLPDTGDCEPWR